MPPFDLSTQSARSPQAISPKTPYQPPSRRSPTEREPLTTWPAWLSAHRTGDQRLKQYLADNRKGSVRLSRAVMAETGRNAEKYLYANNLGARIRFAQISIHHIEELVEAAEDTLFFWVTLTPQQFAMTEDVAASFDTKRLQAWARQELHGFNFIGMAEGALFTNIGDIKTGARRFVSWHVHLIVWGITEARIAKITADINRRYATIIYGIDPAYAEPLPKQDIVGKVLYMLKSPQSEYRIYPKRTTKVDEETGVITTPTTGRFKLRKRDLRTGDKARMYNVLSDKYLDRLLFAGGDGSGCIKGIRTEALKPLRQYERSQAVRQSSPRTRARLPQ